MMSGLRFLTSAVIAVFTAVVFVLIQPAVWSPSITAATAVVVIGTAGVAYFRPHNGLLVLAALAPLGGVWGPLLGHRMRAAEALVLAFLAGALLRGWTLHSFRRVPLNRLLPDLFLRSNEELYEPLLLVLECWMANPGDGLNELDELERRNHSAVLRIYELVTTLLSTTGNVPTPPEAGRLLDFLDLNPVRSYGELRTGLRTFCLDEGTTLPCVAELVAQRPEYDEFHAQRLSELMNADVPLQTLLLGIYTFWQA